VKEKAKRKIRERRCSKGVVFPQNPLGKPEAIDGTTAVY
jgi:hypothetical protein